MRTKSTNTIFITMTTSVAWSWCTLKYRLRNTGLK